MKNIFLLSFITLLFSCSENGSHSSPASQQEKGNKAQENLVSAANVYATELSPVNQNISSLISGTANMKIENGDLYAYIRMTGSLTGLIHEQRFYQASACPTLDDDTNNDGIIDIKEANHVLGQPIFPLDADISSLEAGKDTFPAGDASGTYWYEQIINFQTLQDELHLGDKSLEDDFVGLPLEETLSLQEGVVMILGVPAFTQLPPTVASTHGYANFQLLPVACGSLQKVFLVPGRIEDDRGVNLPAGPVGGANGEYDNATVIVEGRSKGNDYGDDDL